MKPNPCPRVETVRARDDASMNNVTSFPDKARIKQEAGVWLARLDQGSLSQNKRRELREWMATSHYHADYLRKLVTNWDRMDVLSELAEMFPLNADEQVANNSKRWAGSLALAGAAALMVLSAGIWFTMQQPSNSNPPATETASSVITYHTAIGEFTSFQLQDGSTIKLNTNSLVEVEFDDHFRTISLLRGEANFRVASNPDRPFVVVGGNGVVWAVGTQFNVRLLNDEVDVTVTEGKVKVLAGIDSPKTEALIAEVVRGDDQPLLLEAGQSVRYNNVVQLPEIHAKDDIALKLAWQQGSLVFQGESLEQAVAEISRYTNQQLVIVDPAISDISIGGHFKTDDIEGLIAALSTNFNIRSEQVAPNQIHLSSQ